MVQYMCLSACRSGFVAATLCTTAAVQSYLHCAPAQWYRALTGEWNHLTLRNDVSWAKKKLEYMTLEVREFWGIFFTYKITQNS